MNVLLVNTQDRGGAARACLRLLDGLRMAHVDAKALLLRRNAPGSPQLQVLGKPASKLLRAVNKMRLRSWERRNRRLLRGRNTGWDIFSFGDAPHEITLHPCYVNADVINLHWVADYIDYRSFFRNNKKPVVWTLHDMNPFTGGCHYAGSCTQYHIHCQDCPQLQGAPAPQFVRQAFQRKADALVHVDPRSLVIVALSRWMLGCASSSALLGRFEHRLIPNGLDSTLFRPRSRTICRQMLGLPEDRKIILFIGDDVGNARKGFNLFHGALSRLHGTGSLLALVVGSGSREMPAGDEVKYWGPVADEHLMAMMYSAADVYVCSSIEDNLPNTVMESLMCGTPVAGFAVGGVTDMVRDGIDGRVSAAVTAEALACSISDIITHPEAFSQESIREGAVNRFSLEIQAEAYRRLYEELLARQTP